MERTGAQAQVFEEGPDEPFAIRPRQSDAYMREQLRHELVDTELAYVDTLNVAIDVFLVGSCSERVIHNFKPCSPRSNQSARLVW